MRRQRVYVARGLRKRDQGLQKAVEYDADNGGSIYTKADVSRYRQSNGLTWHELNDGKHMQLVPTEINAEFTHVGGVGEINAGAYAPGGFATK